MRLILTILAILILATAIGWGRYFVIGQTFEVRVRSLHNKIIRGEDKYLVFTDEGVFENVDSWIWLKFDSAEFQNRLDEGACYKMKTRGLRIPILSWYKNIHAVTRVDCPHRAESPAP